jgi:hypothetical protein
MHASACAAPQLLVSNFMLGHFQQHEDFFASPSGLDEAHLQIVQNGLQQIILFSGEITARFFMDKIEGIDGMLGKHQVLDLFIRARRADFAQMVKGRGIEGNNEGLEGNFGHNTLPFLENLPWRAGPVADPLFFFHNFHHCTEFGPTALIIIRATKVSCQIMYVAGCSFSTGTFFRIACQLPLTTFPQGSSSTMASLMAGRSRTFCSSSFEIRELVLSRITFRPWSVSRPTII